MSLLAPAFLWALAGLSVPIALHLLGRGQRRVVPFSNVRWLVARPSLRGLRFAPSDPWLLAARAALVALVALALAQPACRDSRPIATREAATLDLEGEPDVWGALRAADRDLPPGQPIRLAGRPAVVALLGARPASSREIVLDDTPRSEKARDEGGSATPGEAANAVPIAFRIRWDGAPDARVDRSVRRWLEELASLSGHAAFEQPVETVGGAPDIEVELVAAKGAKGVAQEADGDRGAWIGAALEPPWVPMPFSVRATGGTLSPSPPNAAVWARDDQGRPLVTLSRRGVTRALTFAIPLAPESTDLLRREAWAELGLALFAPWLPPGGEAPRVASMESLAPRRITGEAAARVSPPRWDRRPTAVVWWVALVAFLGERALAWRRATS
jgi:hypothetical protein